MTVAVVITAPLGAGALTATTAPADPDATPEARSLFSYLRGQQGRGVLSGHQQTTEFGVTWDEPTETAHNKPGGVHALVSHMDNFVTGGTFCDTEQFFLPHPATGDLPEHELLPDLRRLLDAQPALIHCTVGSDPAKHLLRLDRSPAGTSPGVVTTPFADWQPAPRDTADADRRILASSPPSPTRPTATPR